MKYCRFDDKRTRSTRLRDDRYGRRGQFDQEILRRRVGEGRSDDVPGERQRQDQGEKTERGGDFGHAIPSLGLPPAAPSCPGSCLVRCRLVLGPPGRGRPRGRSRAPELRTRRPTSTFAICGKGGSPDFPIGHVRPADEAAVDQRHATTASGVRL